LGRTGRFLDADPRVQEGVGDVHQQVDQDVGARRDQDDTLNQRVIPGEDRLHDEPPEAGHHEDLLGHHGTAHEGPHLEAQDGDDRNETIPEGMTEHDHPFRQVLAVRGPDIIRTHDLDHAVAGLAHQHGRQRAAEHERGHEHALEIAQRVLEERDEARGGQQMQTHREEQDQHDPQPERGDRDPAQRHRIGQEIPDRVAAHGRENTSGDGDPDGDDQGEARELDRDRKLHCYRLNHRLPRPDRLAQISPQGQPDPAEVLDGDGVIQAILRTDLLKPRLVRVRPGHHPGGIAGDHPDPREDDQGDQEEGHDGDCDPPNQEIEHG
jgi:hypothetical protein